MNDSVLYHLFHMGTFNWRGKNILGNQACQAIQWACPTIFHIFQRVLKVEKQVHSLQFIFLLNED